MKELPITAALAVFALLLGGCMATGAEYRPVVDGGDPQKYEADLEECQQLARERKYNNPDARTNTALGGAVGAVFDGLEGAAAGAATGAGGSAFVTVRERKAIVSRCMSGRGHKVVGP